MKANRRSTMCSTLLACCLAAALSAAHASESEPAITSGVGTSATTETKLSAEFADFLGGEDQAAAVVSGLRQSTAFSLDAPTPTPHDATTTVIDPPTKPMGYGNVRITLRLAEAELSTFGITQPTTDELAAVLLGGEINGTAVDGILTMRADGMGWGQIAQTYGMTVGQIMGKGAGVAQPVPTPYSSSKTDDARPASQAHANGYIPGGGNTRGSGMVTAAGDSVGGSEFGSSKGHSRRDAAPSKGAAAVSAASQPVTFSGGSNAGDGAKALAPGQARKN